ncbi:uncharacterized protein LOC133403775 isoform X1 [Phycodurus eques]|uniref:uncharacterized protein LOC133403775 isoform X1 n=3 Tax=Phycodurus eques TaxID=693459 RepID=UPI002ACD47A8|nr:uncharacterized protein LOC133403775 isoform X1 [Phycodurus eques]
MSTDDFQTKYTSFIESVVKSTVAETTKLFETMVDELKAELTKVKTENEALKQTCRQMEDVKTQAIRESGQRGGPKMRDTAVQCDLLPGYLLPEVQPVKQSTDEQNKQCNQEDLVYTLLKDHDYDAAKDENSKLTVSLSNHEDYEPLIVSRNILCAVADSPPNSACGNETEDPEIDKQCLKREVREKLETLVAPVHPSLEEDHNLHEARNQLINPLNYLNSLVRINNNIEVAASAGQILAELGTQGCASPTTTFEEQLEASKVKIQQASIKETPVHEQAYVTMQLYSGVPPPVERKDEPTLVDKQLGEQIKCGLTEDKTKCERKVPQNRNERKQPSEKVKRLQKTPMKTPLSSIGAVGASHDEVRNSPSNCVEVTSSCWVAEVSPDQPQEAVTIVFPSLEKRRSSASEDVENHNNVPHIVSVLSLSEVGLSSVSEHPCMDMKEALFHAQSSDIPSASKLLNNLTTLSPQASSHQLRERTTSVALQDAMLLVEAMDQSTKNCTSPQEKATAQDQCTFSVTLPSAVKSSLPTQALASQSPNKTLFVTFTRESRHSQTHIRVPTVHQHGVTSSGIITSTSLLPAPASKSHEQCSLHTPSILAAPLETLIVSDSVPNKIFLSKSPSTLPQCMIAPLSPNQISAVVSTVAGAHDKSTSSSSELSQGKNEVTFTTAARLVMSDTTKQRSGPIPQTQIKIIIPRGTAVVASPQQLSETLVAPTNQNSVGPDVTLPSSLHPHTFAQIIKDEKETPLPIILSTLSSPKLECLSQPISIYKKLQITPGHQTSASSTKSVRINSFPLVQSIRLIRLPHLALSTKSVLVSQLFSHRKESEVLLHRTSSLINDQASKSTVCPFEVSLSTNMFPNFKQTSVAETVNASSISKKASTYSRLIGERATCLSPCTPSSVSNPVLDKSTMDFAKAGLSAESDQAHKTSLPLDENIINNAEQNCGSQNDYPTPLQVSPITKDISDPHLQLTKTQFLAQLAVSPVIQDSQKVLTIESTDVQSVCEGTSTDGRRKSQKNSIVARLQCHLKMHSQTKRTKTIPEQLTGKQHPAESPKKHRLENFSTTDQESTNELICVCTNVASSLSPTGTLSETEFFQGSPRNHQSTDISSTESRTTFEPVSVNPPNLGVSKSSSALKNTTDSALIIPSLPQTEINVSHVNSITMGDTIEDITINSKRPFFAEGCASKTFESIIYPQSSSTTDTPDMTNMKLSPQSSFPSNPCTNNAVSEKSGDSSQSPASSLTIDKLCLTQTTFPVGITGKPSTNKDETSQNKLKATTVCLRSSTTQVTTTPLKTKFPPGSQKRRFSAKENAGNEKTQLNCHRDQSVHTKTSPSPPPRTRLTRDYTCPKKSQLPPLSQNESTPVIQNESSLIKNFPSPKMPYCESLRSCNFAKEEHTTKKIKRKSNSLFGKTVAASAWWPKLAKNSASSSTTVESTAKKSRFNQTCTISENTVKVQNAKQLSKAAKATNIANIEQTKLKNTKQVIHHYTSDVTGNKYTSQLVWTAPTTRAREAASLREMRLAILPVQRETRSPRSQNRSVVSPQCLSHHLTHVKDPPIVSPLHPLAVIGERLLKNQCGECGRVLSSSAALESHVSLHTGHRPFSCTLCGKSFPDSKGLKRHGRVHRNGRIHICQQCGKGFVYGFGLTKHLQMVHGKVKPFVCQICNKAFFTKRDVEAHIRIHTGEKPFQCHLCEKKFARRVELNVHLRWHNGEKRHWCPYCGKGFLDYNNMKRHKYIHTGEKPHSCPHCPKHFTQSGHLKKHVKNVHKVK